MIAATGEWRRMTATGEERRMTAATGEGDV